jgi:threonine aldolase
MRQAGILAAAGLIALEEMTRRLGDDHRRAQVLAQGLATIPGIDIDPAVVQTNMVFFTLAATVAIAPRELVATLREHYGIRVGLYHGRTLRAVTHYWITDDHIDQLLQALKHLIQPA